MQTEGSTYSGPVDAAAGIYRKNGVKNGLYAGVSAGMLMSGSCLALHIDSLWRWSHQSHPNLDTKPTFANGCMVPVGSVFTHIY